MSVTLPRAAFVPMAVMLVVVTLLVAVVSFLGLYYEFHYSKWIVEPHMPLPPPTDMLRMTYPVVWLLPMVAVTGSVFLCQRSEISLASAAWFVSMTTTLITVWCLSVALALWCLHAQSGYMGTMD